MYVFILSRMDSIQLQFVVVFDEPAIQVIPHELKEVAVWTTFHKREYRYSIPAGVKQMAILVELKMSELVKDGKIRHWDSICLEVIACSPVMENDGRKGLMKNGNTSFSMKELVQLMPMSGLDTDGPSSLIKPMTIKTYKNARTGVAFPNMDPETYPFFRMLAAQKVDDEFDPLSPEAEKVLIEFWSNKRTEVVQKYLLEKTGMEDFLPGMANFIMYLFEDTRLQPISNFFYTPPDRTSDHGDLHRLYPDLFRRAAMYYCRFMNLDKETKGRVTKRMLDSKGIEKEDSKILGHLANIYVMGICLLSQSLPYISDEYEENATAQQLQEFFAQAEAVKKCKGKSPEEIQKVLDKLWLKLAKATVHGIESFQNIFAMLCGDCEDSGDGILMMHSFFLKYINSKMAVEQKFQMRTMAYIGLNYVCLANLASVTSARPTREDYLHDKYPKMDDKWVKDISTLGGHLFCVLVPLKELQPGGAFHIPGKTKPMKLKYNKGSLAEQLNPDYLDLPVMVGEGTGPGFPAPSVWKHTYPLLKQDGDYWEELQKTAVDDSKASAALMSLLGITGASSTMLSRELEKADVTGNYFYRMIGLCFTGLNYIYPGSDEHVPNAFVWVDKERNQIGAVLTEITYKRNAGLVTLDDFYSKSNLEDPTKTKEWKIFHNLKHFMRPTQVPKDYPLMVEWIKVGNCSGKSFSWFFHPNDFTPAIRAKLMHDLQSVLENYNKVSNNGRYQLDHIDRVNGFCITDPAVYYAQMTYPGSTDHMDRRIGRVEVIVYYE